MHSPREQFRILYRHFLFRCVDLELLAPEGDLAKLLGQFATILILVGLGLSLGTVPVGDATYPGNVVKAWGIEYNLLATTMLVTGLLAVFSWDTTFPSLQDVMVLGPLPVPATLVFAARFAATATALGLAVLLVNAPSGFLLPLALGSPSRSVLDLLISFERYQAFVAFWLTAAMAGLFVYACVVLLQALAALLLPRRQFLNLSALLQLLSFTVLVCTYILQPRWVTPEDLVNPANQLWLECLPVYWFLGLFQQLNGTEHVATVSLARKAWLALGGIGACGAIVYTLTYVRTMRAIVETPDIAVGRNWIRWKLPFSHNLRGAVIEFVLRTIARSRQHRVTLAFYLGLGLAVTILFAQSPRGTELLRAEGVVPVFASFVLMVMAVAGLRVVFNIPVSLRANWIFQVTAVRPPADYLPAIRTPLFAIAVFPVGAAAAVVFLLLWPPLPALGHVLLLLLGGTAIAWGSIAGFCKIPFTCSWSPGQRGGHKAFLGVVGVLFVLAAAAGAVPALLANPARYAGVALVLAVLAFLLRARARASVACEPIVLFEESADPAIHGLTLRKDGVIPTAD